MHLIKDEHGIEEKITQVGTKSCYLSEVTIAELLFGIENSALNRRRLNQDRFASLQTLFSGRILPISNVLHEYARQKAMLRRIGRPIGEFDLLIGATTVAGGFTLATRNTKDFANLTGIQLENWIDG